MYRRARSNDVSIVFLGITPVPRVDARVTQVGKLSRNLRRVPSSNFLQRHNIGKRTEQIQCPERRPAEVRVPREYVEMAIHGTGAYMELPARNRSD